MSGDRLNNVSERWFRLLLRLYPADFRDEMGDALVEAYRDRAREALNRGGVIRLAGVWVQVLASSLGKPHVRAYDRGIGAEPVPQLVRQHDQPCTRPRTCRDPPLANAHPCMDSKARILRMSRPSVP
jgi:hypothetical protein